MIILKCRISLLTLLLALPFILSFTKHHNCLKLKSVTVATNNGIFHKKNFNFVALSDSNIKDVPTSTHQYYLSAFADQKSIIFTWISQIILISFSFLGSYFILHETPSSHSEFSFVALNIALQFSLPLIIIGLIFDRLPIKLSQEISRDTKVFVIRLIGRETTVLEAFVLSFLLSGQF